MGSLFIIKMSIEVACRRMTSAYRNHCCSSGSWFSPATVRIFLFSTPSLIQSRTAELYEAEEFKREKWNLLILQPILLGLYAPYSLLMNNVNIINYPKLWNVKAFSCCCFILQSWYLPFSAQFTSLVFIYVISPGPSDTEHSVEGNPWLQPEIRESLRSAASFSKGKTGTILVRLESWD